MTEFISYSSLLIKFIDPLLDGTEDHEDFLSKAKFGQIAWNFAVSDKNGLPIDKEMKAILRQSSAANSEFRKTLDMMVMRKILEFGEYNQFIFRVENRHKENGTVNLFVESAPVDKMDLKRFKSK